MTSRPHPRTSSGLHVWPAVRAVLIALLLIALQLAVNWLAGHVPADSVTIA